MENISAIDFSYPIFLKNYRSKALLSLYLEYAQDIESIHVLNNYIKLLSGRKPVFQPVLCYERENHYNLRISIFSDVFSNRVHRLAICAKKAGIRLQLLLLSNSESHKIIDRSLFEDIKYVGNPFANMKYINKCIMDFKSDLIHCHCMCTGTPLLFPLVFEACVPVIVDYYDLDNVQYNFWTIPNFEQCLFFEKICFYYADGRCMRSPYLGFPNVKNMYQQGSPISLIPDCIISDWMTNKKETNKNIIVALDANITKSIPSFFKIIDKAVCNLRKHSNIVINMYRAEDFYGRYNDSMINVFGEIPYNKYKEFIESADARFVFFSNDYELAGYNIHSLKFAGMNSIVSATESNTITILPSYFSYLANQLKKIGSGIIYTEKDFNSEEFWEELPGRIRYLRLQEKNFEPLMAEYYGERLKRLYKKSIEYAKIRRGVQLYGCKK